jgi:hypothetical protein
MANDTPDRGDRRPRPPGARESRGFSSGFYPTLPERRPEETSGDSSGQEVGVTSDEPGED